MYKSIFHRVQRVPLLYKIYLFGFFIFIIFSRPSFWASAAAAQQHFSSGCRWRVNLRRFVPFVSSLQETLLFILFNFAFFGRWMREREKRLTPPFAIRSASPDIIHRDNMRPEIKRRGPGNLIIKRTMMISLYRKYLYDIPKVSIWTGERNPGHIISYRVSFICGRHPGSRFHTHRELTNCTRLLSFWLLFFAFWRWNFFQLFLLFNRQTAHNIRSGGGRSAQIIRSISDYLWMNGICFCFWRPTKGDSPPIWESRRGYDLIHLVGHALVERSILHCT